MKLLISKSSSIEVLAIEFNERTSPEYCDLTSILKNIKIGCVKQLFTNTIFITQKSDPETIKNMLK